MSLVENTSALQELLNIAMSLPNVDDVIVEPEPYEPVLQDKIVTPTKALQDVTADVGFDALNKVTVNPIPNQYIVPSGSQTKTENGTYDVTNLSTLVVNIPITKYYTGSSVPSSSVGNNGDLYLVV